jgi:hypothetical protein
MRWADHRPRTGRQACFMPVIENSPHAISFIYAPLVDSRNRLSLFYACLSGMSVCKSLIPRSGFALFFTVSTTVLSESIAYQVHIDTVEVWGSSPHGPTIRFRMLRGAAILFRHY